MRPPVGQCKVIAPGEGNPEERNSQALELRHVARKDPRCTGCSYLTRYRSCLQPTSTEHPASPTSLNSLIQLTTRSRSFLDHYLTDHISHGFPQKCYGHGRRREQAARPGCRAGLKRRRLHGQGEFHGWWREGKREERRLPRQGFVQLL